MPLAITTPPVKMCLERPAGRDKHEKMEFPLLLSERSGDNSKSFILKRGHCNAKHRPDLCG